MELLADANWLGRLELEYRQNRIGPARKLLKKNRIWINPVVHCEVLSAGKNLIRREILHSLQWLEPMGYTISALAADLRYRQSKKRKTLHTPDALIAATAILEKKQLLTADRDFSGIPGLKWSSYPE